MWFVGRSVENQLSNHVGAGLIWDMTADVALELEDDGSESARFSRYVEVFPGALQTEQKTGVGREALENETNLKASEAYHRATGSKYLVGSSSAPYCNKKYPMHVVILDARTQQLLIDQLLSEPK